MIVKIIPIFGFVLLTGCQTIELKNPFSHDPASVEVVESKPSFVNDFQFTLVSKSESGLKTNAKSLCKNYRIVSPMEYIDKKNLYMIRISCPSKKAPAYPIKKDEESLITEEMF